MTTPHEAVTRALSQAPAMQTYEADATCTIEALREGAELRLRAAFPDMKPVVCQIAIDAILGPPSQPKGDNG